MPRQANSYVENSFTKGLITEATGLNFPDQAVTDTSNCVFDQIGTVRRRPGFDLEWGYSTQTVDRTGKAMSTYRWDAAAGNGDNTIAVVQIGSTLYFYFVNEDSAAVSDDPLGTLDLSVYLPSGSVLDVADAECQYAVGKGYLFVANPHMESIYLAYDEDARTVSATQIELKIRDFEGVEDSVEIDERPTVETSEHKYNLFNQGWYKDNVIVTGSPITYDDAYGRWFSARADYPSNADIWWSRKRFDAGGSVEVFDSNLFSEDPDNTPAPKGHYLLNPYEKDRSTVSGITGLTTTSSNGYRASTVAFFAGRVWYSGVRGTDYSNQIYFTQIIESVRQVGWCFQQNDPTGETLSDLLASDGGTLTIPEAGTIIKLFPFEDSLLIFATNGVWKISGSQGIGFAANDYSVNKVASIPALTGSSFVSIAGVPAFWNSEGIYTINANSQLGQTSVVSITDTTIKSFFDDIPLESKRYARGDYNRRTRVVTWVYRATDGDKYSFDSILNLNTLSNAFYTWSTDTSDVNICGVLVCPASEVLGVDDTVVDNNAATVTNDALATVTAFNIIEGPTPGDVTKFLLFSGTDMTFGEPWNSSYKDWYSLDNVGVDYTSYFVTGFKINGAAQRKSQPTYIIIFFETSDEDNSIDFQSLWDYATDADTGKWSSSQRITTTDNDYSHTKRRIKTRGSGLAHQFKVTSVTAQGFNIVGWSVFETSNAGV